VTPLSPIAPTATHASEGTRPRVEGDREQEIFDATLQVLEEVGYDRLTMDAVASAARASKATLYRRWNGKVALVIDALISQKGQPVVPDTGTLRGDLHSLLHGALNTFGRGRGQFVARLLREAGHHPEITDLVDAILEGTNFPDAARARITRDIPLGRLGTPPEVADMCVYLLSDEARFVTGAHLQVDGGSYSGLL